MKYSCSTCGHKDDADAFYGDQAENEVDLDEVIYVTCPSCGDTFTESCLNEHY